MVAMKRECAYRRQTLPSLSGTLKSTRTSTSPASHVDIFERLLGHAVPFIPNGVLKQTAAQVNHAITEPHSLSYHIITLA
jgi:hypothetical protein